MEPENSITVSVTLTTTVDSNSVSKTASVSAQIADGLDESISYLVPKLLAELKKAN